MSIDVRTTPRGTATTEPGRASTTSAVTTGAANTTVYRYTADEVAQKTGDIVQRLAETVRFLRDGIVRGAGPKRTKGLGVGRQGFILEMADVQEQCSQQLGELPSDPAQIRGEVGVARAVQCSPSSTPLSRSWAWPRRSGP